MKKRELASAIAAQLAERDLSADLVELVIQATMDHLTTELARTGRLEYRDLGVFTVESYKARKIHNPKTGAIIDLPARKGVSFKPGQRLMNKVPPPTEPIATPAALAPVAVPASFVPPPPAPALVERPQLPVEGPVWVRLKPSPFVTAGSEFGPLLHQAIVMASGRIIRREGRCGQIEIDGYRYEFIDKRSKPRAQKYPLAKFEGQTFSFSFWPTLEAQALADHAPDDPPVINISALRPKVPDPGLVQVIGLVDTIAEDHVLIAIHTQAGPVVYVFLQGRYTGKVGDLVQASGHLIEGVLTLESWHLLHPEAAPPGTTPQLQVDQAAPPAPQLGARVRYHPSPFLQEVGQWIALRPQSVGMAVGRILAVPTHDAPGTIEIDGHAYPFLDRRQVQFKERVPLATMMERDLMFSFGAMIGSRADNNRSVRPVLHILSLRTKVQDSGLVQVIGQVESIEEDRVRFVLHHGRAFYYTSFSGRYTGQVGELVQAFGRLVAGEMVLERWHVLEIEPAAIAIPGQDVSPLGAS